FLIGYSSNYCTRRGLDGQHVDAAAGSEIAWLTGVIGRQNFPSGTLTRRDSAVDIAMPVRCRLGACPMDTPDRRTPPLLAVFDPGARCGHRGVPTARIRRLSPVHLGIVLDGKIGRAHV